MPQQAPLPAQPAAALVVRVRPRAAGNRLEGWREGRLLVRTTAPPIDGRANEAVCRLIAEALGIPSSRVQVTRGGRAREKTVQVRSLSQPDALRRLKHPDFV